MKAIFVLLVLFSLAAAQELIYVNRSDLSELCRESLQVSQELVIQLNLLIAEQKRLQMLYYNRLRSIKRT